MRKRGIRGYDPGSDFEIDEAHEFIDMLVKIDQQAQYRVGSIEFLGVNTVTQEKLMESLPSPERFLTGPGWTTSSK
jgi:hypothetical protein